MGSVIMSNSKNNVQNTPKSYDAGDMADVYSESCEFTEWLSALITQVKKEKDQIKVKLSTHYNVDSCCFHTLDKLLDLSEFMADDRVATLERLHQEHNQEWEANKKAVTL
jgi:hypothetical protein